MTAVPATAAPDGLFDPLEPAGAAELYRRVEAAPPQRVERAELAGHVGLTDRELYELGCTLAPPGVTGVGAMIGWRVVAFAGAVVTALGLAMAAAGTLVPLLGGLGDPDPIDAPRGAGLAVLTLAAAAGGGWLLRRAVDRLRALAARRRRAERSATSPAEDRHARATVQVSRAPGLVRVRLLWVRGAAGRPADVEVRVLAERRIEEDDRGRAEDAIAELSEVALRAGSAHALHLSHGLAALGVRRRLRRHPARLEPPTDEGATEVARRLAVGPRLRWSAEALAPLLIDRPDPRMPEPPPWPSARSRTRQKRSKARLRPLRVVTWIGLATFVFAMFSGGDDGPPAIAAVAIGCAGLVAAALAWAARRRRLARDPARRLWRAVRAAAPGGIFVLARGVDRTAVLHVRAAPNDERRGELEVVTIAHRDATDLGTVQDLWTIADDARSRDEGVGRTTRRLRSLTARLGRATAAAEASLAREPLVWIAALVVPLLLAASIKHFVTGTWAEDGVGNRVLSFAWPLFAAVLLVRAAERIRDPYARD